MSEEGVAALAGAIGLPLPPERLASVAELLEAMSAGGGGATPEDVAGVEPAIVFEPRLPS